MLQTFSWIQYMLFVGCSLVVYYLVLSVWMAKKRLIKNRNRQRDPAGSTIKRTWSPKDVYMPNESELQQTQAAPASSFSFSGLVQEKSDAEEAAKQLMPQVHDLLDEVQALFENMKDNPNKELILQNLHKIIHKYPAIINSSYRPNISTMIMVNSEKECALHLSADEVSGLWQ